MQRRAEAHPKLGAFCRCAQLVLFAGPLAFDAASGRCVGRRHIQRLKAGNLLARQLEVLGIEADASVRVLVLTGAGERAFCAGRDLNEPTVAGETMAPYLGEDVPFSKPAVAAVNGLAYGGGWFLAQMCDVVVASEDAEFALPGARVGAAPAWAVWLHGVVPEKAALELLMTGNRITALRAHQIGLDG